VISRPAIITFTDGPGVDNSLPGNPAYPSQGLPGVPGVPSNPIYIPPPGHIATLPVFPFDPTKPDNSLPGTPGGPSQLPVQIRPGLRLVVKWLCGVGLILVPDNELPETPEPK